MAFACDEVYEIYSKYFPMNAIGHVTKNLTLIYFLLLRGYFFALA